MTEYCKVAEFSIPYLRFLDEEGRTVQPLPNFAHDKDYWVNAYRTMLMGRYLDEKAMSLQRTGQLGTYAQAIGQEAVTVGVGLALAKEDIFVPYYRDHATLLQRQISATEIYRYWGGDEHGANYKDNKNDFPYCIPIATQTLHAAGVATAVKYQHEGRAVLTTCGDGATSKGDFYEAMNIAGLWYLPLVFVVNNNQWAISIPRSHQTNARTLAQKAIAAGLPCSQVDGNDIVAVHYAVREALQKAREGKGATVIEALSYRLCDHTTADDATRYQKKDEVDAARLCEPLIRTKKYLMQHHHWSEQDDQEIHQTCKKQIEQAAQNYLALDKPMVEDMFDYLFEQLPESLQSQRQHAIAHAQRLKEQDHD